MGPQVAEPITVVEEEGVVPGQPWLLDPLEPLVRRATPTRGARRRPEASGQERAIADWVGTPVVVVGQLATGATAWSR